ncbi:unnamed protein product [Schistosoma curassoni]|uniref:Uncharacterized protein n=1 Tax=Schistosoma curassoni TaxID=6186 RepID=A0A183L6P6_9TREM|nr:unnamed protein product [Schistosoma curassoni]
MMGRAQTKLRHYGSSLNSQLSGTRHTTSISLTTRKHVIASAGQHYGGFFDTTESLRK